MAVMRFYAGSYTESDEKGIFLLEFDPARATLDILDRYGGGPSPSFLIRRGDMLFAANETADKGYVTALRITPKGLVRTGGQGVPGAHTCHCALSPDGALLYAANYTSGNVFACPVGKDGALGDVCAEIRHSGSSVHVRRQESAHAHSITPDPSGRFVVVCDLGMDKLMVYRTDAGTGRLAPNPEQAFLSVGPGEGPRHMVFHPSGGLCYAVMELGASVYAFDYDTERGVVTHKARYPLMDGPLAEGDLAADIHLTADGKRLYCTLRGKNIVSAFEVGENGGLVPIGAYSTCGDGPRTFLLTPDGAYIVFAHTGSGEVTLCPLDKDTGAVGEKICVARVPGASTVVVAD